KAKIGKAPVNQPGKPQGRSNAPQVPGAANKGNSARTADLRNVQTRVGGANAGERKKAMYSAVISYFQALRKATELTRLEQTLAREGIKNLGAKFVEDYPKDEFAPQVKFNVARAYYEQGELAK